MYLQGLARLMIDNGHKYIYVYTYKQIMQVKKNTEQL